MSEITEIVRPRPTLEECYFYHTIDLPDGPVKGQWDLRAKADTYLGSVDFRDKTVLEIGPASGFLTFHMEQAGAAVTAVEPPMTRLWDFVPPAGPGFEAWRTRFNGHIIGVRNSFWYLHHLYSSTARLVEATPESLPASLGDFDVGVLASVLMHTRSPLLILASTAARVRETLIITELYNANLGTLPVCHFLPQAGNENYDTWWAFTPEFFQAALASLGFPRSSVTIHHQRHEEIPHPVPLYTVVAHRTP